MFTPSVGGGATLEVASNPGRNGLGLWVGLSFGL